MRSGGEVQVRIRPRVVAAYGSTLLGLALVADLVQRRISGLHNGQSFHVAVAGLGLLGAYSSSRKYRQFRRPVDLWFMLGGLAWGLGHLLIAIGADMLGSSRWNPVTDVVLLIWSSCALIGLWQHTRSFDRSTRFGFLADSMLFSTGCSFIIWELVIVQRVNFDLVPFWTQLFALLLLSLGMLCVSILLMMTLIARSPARLVLLAAMVCLTVGDIAYASGSRPFAVATGPVSLVAWLLGGCFLVFAGSLSGGAGLDYRRPSGARLIIAALPGGLAIWLAAWLYVINDHKATFGAIVLGFMSGLLVGLVQAGSWAQSTALTNRLEHNIEALRDSEADLRNLMNDLPTAVLVLTGDGLVTGANAGALDLTGRTLQDLQGTPFVDLIPEQHRESLLDVWVATMSGIEQPSPIFEIAHPLGHMLMIQASVRTPVVNPQRVVVDLRDITAEIANVKSLGRAEEQFRLAFHNAPSGMAIARAADGVLVDVNESLVTMLGYERESLIGSSVRSITHPDDWVRNESMMARVAAGSNEPYRIEKRYLHRDGGLVWAMTSVSVMTSADGLPHTIAHIEDITERRSAVKRLEWSATHDELTQLPNRFRFLDQLGQSLQGAEPGSVAVLFIDLDNFKVINDSLGHAVGDQLLRGMSDRLRTVVRDRDLLGRFGGDEFIVMLRDIGGSDTPSDVAERLRVEIAKPLIVEEGELFVTASIGIALAEAGATTTDLLRDADAAMYRAKARGRDCVEVFAPGSHAATVLTLRTTTELRRGLERGEIVPYYQPIVDLRDGRLRGFEVLARWQHPDRGLLSPDQFLPMAEETGLIGDVGAAVLRSSLSQLGLWQEQLANFRDLTVSVNVSVRQLMSNALHEVVAQALAESGVSADALWLEITETALMTDTKAAANALRELRSLGLHLAVDDFGTGYSSLTYLKRFPVESIKVDRTFVNGLGINPEDTTIVEAVVKLGHSLGLTVVAEGVETPLQLTRLRDVNCDFGQGYLFGRPRPAEMIEAEYSMVQAVDDSF